jgi:peptidoglycan glycosyltransferase
VREVRSPDGIILDRPTASVRNGAVPSDTAATLNDMMQRVIEDGELTGAQIEGTKVAGKTGTAENAAGEPHSWFVSYAPADDPEIAVAVMIENGGIIREDGSAETPALNVAGNLMRAYLDRPAPTPEPEQRPQAPWRPRRPARRSAPPAARTAAALPGGAVPEPGAATATVRAAPRPGARARPRTARAAGA